MEGLTFDTGFLIAIDRGNRDAWAFWRFGLERELPMTIPALVIAQAWRGHQNARMGMFINSCVVEGLDHTGARRIGELLAASNTSDVVDSALVLSAANRGDRVVTADVADITHLAGFVSGLGRIIDINAFPRR